MQPHLLLWSTAYRTSPQDGRVDDGTAADEFASLLSYPLPKAVSLLDRAMVSVGGASREGHEKDQQASDTANDAMAEDELGHTAIIAEMRESTHGNRDSAALSDIGPDQRVSVAIGSAPGTVICDTQAETAPMDSVGDENTTDLPLQPHSPSGIVDRDVILSSTMPLAAVDGLTFSSKGAPIGEASPASDPVLTSVVVGNDEVILSGSDVSDGQAIPLERTSAARQDALDSGHQSRAKAFANLPPRSVEADRGDDVPTAGPDMIRSAARSLTADVIGRDETQMTVPRAPEIPSATSVQSVVLQPWREPSSRNGIAAAPSERTLSLNDLVLASESVPYASKNINENAADAPVGPAIALPKAVNPAEVTTDRLVPGFLTPLNHPDIAVATDTADIDPAPSLSRAPAAVHRQLADAIVTSKDGIIKITLSPDELGPVKVVISRDDHLTRLSISAERPETLDLVRRHADLLVRDLRDSGAEQSEINFASSHGQGHQGHERNSAGDAASATLSDSQTGDPHQQGAIVEPATSHTAGDRRIDIRI